MSAGLHRFSTCEAQWTDSPADNFLLHVRLLPRRYLHLPSRTHAAIMQPEYR